jgi:hypothetical protein
MTDREFFDDAREFLSDRRGRVLFVGGDPTDMVLDYVKAGRFVSVNRPTPQAAERLRAGLKALGAERQVTLDPRPYQAVEFDMSAFDGIVMAEPDPAETTAKALFKQVKHDLKTAGCFIARVKVQRDPAALPRLASVLQGLEKARVRLPDRLAARLAVRPSEGLVRAEIKQFAEKYLKVAEVRYFDPLPELERLPPGVRALMQRADVPARLAGTAMGDALCTRALVKLTNERDFGTVFMKHVRRD